MMITGRGAEAGLSPGYGLSLVAETTKGIIYSAEAASQGGEEVEAVAQRAAMALLAEIRYCLWFADCRRGGCVDTPHQALGTLCMVLCPESVCKLRTGKLSNYT
jgi:RNA 3'-terminal phosphate cyclase-like protein